MANEVAGRGADRVRNKPKGDVNIPILGIGEQARTGLHPALAGLMYPRAMHAEESAAEERDALVDKVLLGDMFDFGHIGSVTG